MKNKCFAFLLCAVIILGLCGCNNDFSDGKEIDYKPTEVENVSIGICDVSPIGAKLIIKDDNKEPYTYGEWYKIEKKNNDTWVDVETIIDNYSFTNIGYIVDTYNAKNELEFDIDWEWLYGKLQNGDYRVLKKVNNQYIFAEFSITTNP